MSGFEALKIVKFFFHTFATEYQSSDEFVLSIGSKINKVLISRPEL